MKVLSLFDGISCGRIALERAGIKIDKYFTSEIDKYAIQVSKKNWPDIVHIGDIRGVTYYNDELLMWDKERDNSRYQDFLGKIDIIIGGSPCQDLSIAKSNGKGLQGEKSGLFFEYVRLLKECKPKYFLLENVNSMKKADKDEITRVLMEVYPDTDVHMINSALVSAQNRKRLYWTNIPGIVQPEDKNIMLRDVLEDIPFDEEESNYPKKAGSSIIWRPIPEKYITDSITVRIPEATKIGYIEPEVGDVVDMQHPGSTTRRGRLMRGFGKSNTIYTGDKMMVIGNRDKAYYLTARYTGASPRDYFEKHQRTLVMGIVQKPRGKNNGGLVQNGDKSPTINASRFQDNNFVLGSKKMEFYWRKLTPIECERIQTINDNYTAGISNTQRYKSIGNAWSPDTVVVFLKKLKEILESI